MSKTSRRKFTAEFKAKVCIEALKERQSIESLSKKYDLHPTQINTWKKEFLGNSAAVFEKEGKDNTVNTEQLIQAVERRFIVLLIQHAHDIQILLTFFYRLIIRIHNGSMPG